MNATLMGNGTTTPLSLPNIVIVFITLQQIIFVLACFGNACVIYIVLRYLVLQDNLYVINLAIADFFTGVSSGVQIFYVFYPSLNENLGTCMLRFQIVQCMTMASQLTVCLLSLDRYAAICHQEWYDKVYNKKIASLFVALPWVVSLSISIPPFLGWTKWNEVGVRCSYSLVFTHSYFWTIALLTLCLSFLSCAAHFRIYLAIRKFHRRVQPAGDLSMAEKKLKKKIKGAKVTLFVTMVFTFCWLPYITFPFAYANGYEKDFNLRQASSWLVFFGMLSSVIHPVIYAYYKTDIRIALKNECTCC